MREVGNQLTSTKAANNRADISRIEKELGTITSHSIVDIKIYNKMGMVVLEELAKSLWSNFYRVRAEALGDDYAKSQRDNVAKARLIFSWLTLSIKCNDKLFKVPRVPRPDKGSDNYGTENLLVNRAEVCQLYSHAFQWMLNAIGGRGIIANPKTPDTESEEAKAEYIEGLARSCSGGPPEGAF